MYHQIVNKKNNCEYLCNSCETDINHVSNILDFMSSLEMVDSHCYQYLPIGIQPVSSDIGKLESSQNKRPCVSKNKRQCVSENKRPHVSENELNVNLPNFIIITSSESFAEFSKITADKPIVIMYYKKSSTECNRAIKNLKSIAANNSMIYFLAIDVDKFSSDSCHIKNVQMVPKFDGYYSGKLLSSTTNYGKKDIQQILNTIQQYVAISNSKKNNNGDTNINVCNQAITCAQNGKNNNDTNVNVCNQVITCKQNEKNISKHRDNVEKIKCLIKASNFAGLMNYIEFDWSLFTDGDAINIMKSCDETSFKYLIDNTLDLDISLPGAWRPIHYACRHGSIEMVKLLINKNVDLEAENSYGWRPIHAVCRYRSLEFLKLIMEKNVHLTAKINSYDGMYSSSGILDLIKLNDTSK